MLISRGLVKSVLVVAAAVAGAPGTVAEAATAINAEFCLGWVPALTRS